MQTGKRRGLPRLRAPWSPRCERHCLRCGVAFRTTEARVARGNGRFCSRACQDLARRQREARTCERCGAAFEVKASLPEGKGRFCSRACLAATWPAPRQLTCQTCGADFEAKAATPATKRFCSKVCHDRFQRRFATLEEAFWARASVANDPDRCWGIAGDMGSGGYTVFRWAGRYRYGHRVSYRLHHGPLPAGHLIRHTCAGRYAPGDLTYRKCCNPAHLVSGTYADNSHDTVTDGRSAKGEGHGRAKATEALVREWRRRYAAGEASTYRLAREVGVSKTTVLNVVTGRTWKHVV